MTQGFGADDKMGSGASIPSMPSRLLTLSACKSLSAMASLDLSWLAEAPSTVGITQPPQNNPGNSEENPQEGPVPMTHDADNTAVGGCATPSPCPTPPQDLGALQAAHMALMEAQTGYFRSLMEAQMAQNTHNGCGTPPPAFDSLHAAQQHLAMQQAYFAAALMQSQNQGNMPNGYPQSPPPGIDPSVFAAAMMSNFNCSAATAASGTSTVNGGCATPTSPGGLGTGGVGSFIPVPCDISTNGCMPPPYSTALPFSQCGPPMMPPLSPSHSRADAMAQWAQERALMQALNSPDMETAVQAMSGVVSAAGQCHGTGYPAGGNGLGGMSMPMSMHPGGMIDPVTNNHGNNFNVRISNWCGPTVCVSHAQPIKVSCVAAPSSPVKLEQP